MPSHIIVKYPKQQLEQLFRAETGLLIAQRVGSGVKFGSNANSPEGTFVFMNDQYAAAFIRDYAKLDFTERLRLNDPPPFEIEERDGEPMIQSRARPVALN